MQRACVSVCDAVWGGRFKREDIALYAHFSPLCSLPPIHTHATKRQTVPLHMTRGPGFSFDGFSPLPPSYEPNDEVRAVQLVG